MPFAFRSLFALIVVGVVSGIVGVFFTFVLSGIEHLVFGFTTGTLAEAITKVPAWHRFAAVAGAGLIIAPVWYGLRAKGPKIPSPSQIYQGERISFGWMMADTTLQVANVAAGGSIGREGAPRQMGALFGAKIGGWFDDDMRKVLVASGAGAGLAAIYNVPFGGTLFALEVVIGLRALRGFRRVSVAALSALTVAWLATLIARFNVPDRSTYLVDWPAVDGRLFLFALIVGPLAGGAGYGFAVAMERVRTLAPKGRAILWTLPGCYLLLGLLAVALPLVLGNGHAMAQDLLGQKVSLSLAALLILAKPVATLLTVRAGATGGSLTPSLATGAAMGFVLATLGGEIVPVSPMVGAILGAAAFLAGSMGAPLTAAVLAIEFTGAGLALWLPVAVTIGSAWLVKLGATRFRQKGMFGG